MQRELAMSRAVELARGNPGVGNLGRRIEHPEADTRREQADQGPIDGALGEITLLDRGEEGFVVAVALSLAEVGAFVVHAAFERDRGGLRLARAIVVPIEYVAYRVTVGDHVALEPPSAAQGVLQREFVGAGRLAVDAVVSAHDRSGMTFDDGGAERRQISVFHVVFADIDVGEMARGLRSAVDDEMLRRRDGEVVVGIRALQPGNEGYAHLRGEKGILTIGFLAAAPPRVAEDVD